MVQIPETRYRRTFPSSRRRARRPPRARDRIAAAAHDLQHVVFVETGRDESIDVPITGTSTFFDQRPQVGAIMGTTRKTTKVREATRAMGTGRTDPVPL